MTDDTGTTSSKPQDRPTVVLLPGLDGTGTLFDPIERALSPHADVVRVAYPLDPSLALDALRAIATDRLPTDRPYLLVAESFSGPIAIRLAATRPRGLSGLVLVATFATPPLHPALLRLGAGLSCPLGALPVPAWAIRAAMLGRDAPPDVVAATRTVVDALPAPVLAARLTALSRLTVEDTVPIDVPVTLLEARYDRLVSVGAQRRLRKAFPDAQVEVVDGPHLLLQACPEACARAVLAATSRHTTGPSV